MVMSHKYTLMKKYVYSIKDAYHRDFNNRMFSFYRDIDERYRRAYFEHGNLMKTHGFRHRVVEYSWDVDEWTFDYDSDAEFKEYITDIHNENLNVRTQTLFGDRDRIRYTNERKENRQE